MEPEGFYKKIDGIELNKPSSPIMFSGQHWWCAFSLLMFYAPEIHGKPQSINMIHDEDKCIVK